MRPSDRHRHGGPPDERPPAGLTVLRPRPGTCRGSTPVASGGTDRRGAVRRWRDGASRGVRPPSDWVTGATPGRQGTEEYLSRCPATAGDVGADGTAAGRIGSSAGRNRGEIHSPRANAG